jgi:antitoxin (DNA-binding transcriptional repressor) of toxin-antitoxin stability system
MVVVTIEEAEAALSDLIHRLSPGDEVVIIENEQPVARLLRAHIAPKPRHFGTLKGTVLSMERFGDPLDDFAEYMQ